MMKNNEMDELTANTKGTPLFSFQEMLYMFPSIMIDCVRHHVRDWRLDFACKRSDDCNLKEASFFQEGVSSMIVGLWRISL